jgi:hypothetical protein
MNCGAISSPNDAVPLTYPTAKVGKSEPDGQIICPVLGSSSKLEAINESKVQRTNRVQQPIPIPSYSSLARQRGVVVLDPDVASRTNKNR